MSASPAALLERILNQRVTLRLKDERDLAGTLVGLDEHLNLVLDEAAETSSTTRKRLGRIVVRGSNVITLRADGSAPARAA
ncbi:MAG TPA: LSM domain-containing protein [Thermoplasmata archaeon]|nr:LSM domain-containing protein [Thermoplasmata archaeon]